MNHTGNGTTPRMPRVLLVLSLLALLPGWLGARYNTAVSAQQSNVVAAGGRQLFLPLIGNGVGALPPALADTELSFAVALTPAGEVAPGSLLRATITAFNGGAETLRFRDLTLRYQFTQLVFERAEGERILVTGQNGDSTTATFRSIGPGERVSGTVLFRVREGLPNGATIAIESEYVCGDNLCNGNLAEVQVSSATAGVESLDETQELLVAPTSGGPDTIFRFSSNKFARLDRVQLWLSNLSGSVRLLPQEYQVSADGWVRFELRGAELGVGSWNLLAHGSISGFTSIASFSVNAAQAVTGTPDGLTAPQSLTVKRPDHMLQAPVPSPAVGPAQAPAGGGLAGRVTDAATGAGVADVLVVVLRDGAPVSSARSRANGSYLIPVGLATGSYTVRALASSGGGALAYQDATLPLPVAVNAPELSAGVDIALVRAGAIAGRVTASDTRRGLAGVAIEVVGEGGGIAGSGASGADGSYRVTGLPEGTYSVRLSTETGSDGNVAAYAGATVTDVTVTAGGTVFADAGLSLRPTVAKIRGRVSGPGGGLPEVFVAVFDSEAELVDLTLTEADGSYATGPLASASYRIAFLTFFADNALTRRHISAFYAGGASFAEATPVVVGGPGVVADINGVLTLGGSIAGTVRGEGAAALADVLVAAFDAGGAVSAVARTTSAGAYELTGLPAGSYRIGYFAEYAAGAEVRRYRDGFYNGKATLGEADAVPLSAGQALATIDATLSPGGAIAGQVTADEGGAGLGGVVIIALGATGAIEDVALSDASGAYSLTGLAPGGYTVLFDTILAPVEASRGYIDEYFDDRRAAPFTPVRVTAGGTATASAALARGGQIAGRVTAGDSGLGLSGVTVLVFSGDTLVSFTMSDASGVYTTAGLPAGSYTLRFDPSLSVNQETEQYAAQTLAEAVAVTVGATMQGVDAALPRQ